MTRKRADQFEETVGAIRLALTGAADDRTAVRIVQELVDRAPATDGSSTGPVTLLLKAIRARWGKLTVAS